MNNVFARHYICKTVKGKCSEDPSVSKLKLTNKKDEDEDLAEVGDRKVVPVAHRGGCDGQEPDAVTEPQFSGGPGVTHIQNWTRQSPIRHFSAHSLILS